MKQILNHLASDWYKYLLELIVITAGVLGAFALNNWNEDRRNENRSQEYLVVLSEELDLNINRLTLHLGNIEEMLDNTYYYLKVITSDLPVGDTLVAQLTAKIGPVYIRELSSTAITDLVRSGSLDLLEDEELKRELLKIPTDYENFINNSTSARLHWSDLIRPYYQKNADLLNMWDSVGIYKVPKAKFQPNFDAFYHNREFSNMLVSRLRIMENLRKNIVYNINALEKTNSRIKKRIL